MWGKVFEMNTESMLNKSYFVVEQVIRDPGPLPIDINGSRQKRFFIFDRLTKGPN